MHYVGMTAMSMPDTMRYDAPLFVVSVVIAIVAGTAALWAGTRVRGIGATIGASLIMGVAVSGMHYTGMAAMRVYPDTTSATSGNPVGTGSMATMGGATAASFLLPLLAGICLLTFALTLTISLSPTEDEIHQDTVLRHRMDTEFAGGLHVHSGNVVAPAVLRRTTGGIPRVPTADAFTPRGYVRHRDYLQDGGYPDEVPPPGGA
jgi:hypothetical protein